MLHLDLSPAAPALPADYLPRRKDRLEQAASWLKDATGAGNDFVG